MTKRATSPLLAGNRSKLDAVQSLGFIVATCVCLALSVGFLVGARHRQTKAPSVRPDEKINPNEAPAASLARLPGVGPTRARAIVAYRERVREQEGVRSVFHRADDLEQVRGIGPATVDGIRAWLRFDSPLEEADRSAPR